MFTFSEIDIALLRAHAIAAVFLIVFAVLGYIAKKTERQQKKNAK